jgi:hypothetical protein
MVSETQFNKKQSLCDTTSLQFSVYWYDGFQWSINVELLTTPFGYREHLTDFMFRVHAYLHNSASLNLI